MNTNITVDNDITLVILHNTPADMDFIAKVFEDIAALEIDIDMISIAPVQGSTTSLSFTIKDDDLMKLLGYTSKLKSKNIKPVVSSGNSIISIADEAMKDTPGMAAKIFRAISDSNADIRIVSTSQIQVS
ncbi:MAG: hypothetical protein UE295_04990, partial [Acutalibacteraceae bacterium]|nr:hypothetical protein [Acutalibacteraceae bacterium]